MQQGEKKPGFDRAFFVIKTISITASADWLVLMVAQVFLQPVYFRLLAVHFLAFQKGL